MPAPTRPPRRRDAFTLIELLVVVAIIAALLAILMPSLRQARSAAQTAVCASNLHQLGLGMNTWAIDHRRCFMSSWTKVGAPYDKWPYRLLQAGYAGNDSRLFYCPLRPATAFTGPTADRPDGEASYGQNDWIGGLTPRSDGLSLAKIDDPGRTPLLADCLYYRIKRDNGAGQVWYYFTPRHGYMGGVGNVLWVDLTVSRTDSISFNKLDNLMTW